MIETYKYKECQMNTQPRAKGSVDLVVVYTKIVFYYI